MTKKMKNYGYTKSGVEITDEYIEKAARRRRLATT